MMALESKCLDIHASIQTMVDGRKITTTAGRLIIKSILPDFVTENMWNKVLKRKILLHLWIMYINKVVYKLLQAF